MTKVCNSCGFEETDDSSQFCQICGSRFYDTVNNIQKYPQSQNKSVKFVSNNNYNTPDYYRKRRGHALRNILIIGLVLVLVFSTFNVFNFFNFNFLSPNYDYIQTQEYTGTGISTQGLLQLNFEFYVGEIAIKSSSTLGDVAYSVEQEIYSKDPNNYVTKNVTSTINAETITLLFNERSSTFFSSHEKYNFVITVNEQLNIGTYIDLSVGSVNIALMDVNIISLYALTSTGSLQVNLHNTSFLQNDNVELISSTGSIELTMDDPLFLHTIGSNKVSTSTGSIYVEINNVRNSSVETLQNFDISTSTGTIRALFDYALPCGEKLDLSVSTGFVEVAH